MSQHEKSAWWSLVSALLIWAYLAMRMTDGGQVVELAPGHVISTYITVIVLAIVAAAVPAIVSAAADRSEQAQEPDERDRAIDAVGDRWEGYVVIVAVNVIVVHALATAAYPGRKASLALPDMSSTPTLVFLLLSTLFLAHATKQAVVIWQYRR